VGSAAEPLVGCDMYLRFYGGLMTDSSARS